MRGLIFLLILASFMSACGRGEFLDKGQIESFVDNPFDQDMQSLSDYQGPLKPLILNAKKLSEAMGIKFQKIFVRNGTKGPHIGYCQRGPFSIDTITLFTDELEVYKSESYHFQLLNMLEILVHEWGHCGLNLAHSESGIMYYASEGFFGEPLLDYYLTRERLIGMNWDFSAGLDISVFDKYYAERFLGGWLPSDTKAFEVKNVTLRQNTSYTYLKPVVSSDGSYSYESGLLLTENLETRFDKDFKPDVSQDPLCLSAANLPPEISSMLAEKSLKIFSESSICVGQGYKSLKDRLHVYGIRLIEEEINYFFYVQEI